MTTTEINMHRINLEAVAAYLSGKQEEPDDAPSQHRMAVNRALKDLEETNRELEKVRAYNAVLIAVAKEQPQVVYCKDCKHKSHHYNRFDNQYVCRKNMDKWGKIPEQDLKGHAAYWFCADGEKEKTP